MTSVDGVALMGTVSGALGIIVGILGLTGLTLKLSNIIIELAGGSVALLLVLTMIVSIFFGMGLPTIAAYVLLVILVAPALESIGINLLGAHMFVFYFGCFSTISPPVALGAMTASSIAGSNFWKTGWAAVRIGLVGFILPYAFIYNPQLLLINPSLKIVIPLVTTILGIYALACALVGYFLDSLNWLQRGFLLIGTILLIEIHLWTDIIGLCFLAVVFIPQIIKRYTVPSKSIS